MGALATSVQPSTMRTEASVNAPVRPPTPEQKTNKLLRERLKTMPFLKRIRLRVCAWMVIFVSKHGKEILIEYLMERASEISIKTTMAILDRERIAHCYVCPQRFQLRKVGRRYACSNHSEEVRAKFA